MLNIAPRTICLITLMLLSGCVSRSNQPPAPVLSSGGSAASYKVQPGDTLYSIAWGLELDYLALAEWNDLAPPYPLKAGQSLHLRPVPVSSGFLGSDNQQESGAISREINPNFLVWRDDPGDMPVPDKMRWLWPTVGRVRNERSGIEIKGVIGQPVNAVEIGTVIYSGDGLKGYGNLVIIKHRHNYLSAYGFNRKVLVSKGDVVVRGSRIADMGEGKNGPALYFEIRKGTVPKPPLSLLPKRMNK